MFDPSLLVFIPSVESLNEFTEASMLVSTSSPSDPTGTSSSPEQIITLMCKITILNFGAGFSHKRVYFARSSLQMEGGSPESYP